MATNTTHSIGCGGGTLGLLGIIFVIAKLCKVIDWSWWLVLLPIYLPLAIGFTVIAGFIIMWLWANIYSHY